MSTSGQRKNGFVSLGLAVVVALVVASCDGRTSQSLCKDANGPIEGITGVYDLNNRNKETFGVDVYKIKVIPEGNGKVKVASLNTKDEIKINICNVNGAYVMEAEDKATGSFAPARLYVSQVGLHIAGLMFDKTALDAAGVPNKVISLPSDVQNLLGRTISSTIELLLTKFRVAEDDQQVLYVDNADVSAASLLGAAKPSTVQFTFYRE